MRPLYPDLSTSVKIVSGIRSTFVVPSATTLWQPARGCANDRRGL